MLIVKKLASSPGLRSALLPVDLNSAARCTLRAGISFAQIAQTAFQNGRRQLACMLLENEPLASDQIPLLIAMKEDELALNKAIDSGDTDLGAAF